MPSVKLHAMTGSGFLALILLSMAWLFFFACLIGYVHGLRKAKPGGPSAAKLGFLAGVVGSAAVFFTIPALAMFGIEVPWPWLWILLPLLLVFRVFQKR